MGEQHAEDAPDLARQKSYYNDEKVRPERTYESNEIGQVEDRPRIRPIT